MIWQVYMLGCAQHKCSYHLSPYNAIIKPLTIFPILYLLILWLIYSITESPYLSLPLPILHIPWPLSPLAITSLFSVSMLFFLLCLFCYIDSKYKWNHMVFIFVWLISLNNILPVHPCYHKRQYLILFLWLS